jgi:hypothetical protein
MERGFSRNIRTDESMNAEISSSFDTRPETYTVLANVDTLAKAQKIFDGGVESALTYLNQKIGSGKINAEDVPLSRMVANELAKQGNIDGARAILSDVGVLLTEAGQLSQAANILRNADPVSVEQTVKKSLDRINEAVADRKFEGYKGWTAALTEDEIQQIYNTDFSQEGAYEAFYEQVAKRVGAEMPSGLWEKLTEIRRIAMLLNPKTQVRNIFGNVPLAAMRKISGRMSGAIQGALVNTGLMDASKRTRAAIVSRQSKDIAGQLFDREKGSLAANSNKWDMDKLAQRYRRYFGPSAVGKGVDAVREFTYKLLEKGDTPFLRGAFIDNAAQYIEAQGYKSLDEVPQEVVDFATQQALEATFRDASGLARLLNEMKRKGGIGGGILDILFPFTTTPINIAKRTYEYSPLGMVKFVSDISKRDTAKAVDDLCKSATGSAVVALGFLLSKLGWLTGGQDDDKDKAAWERATGESPYSFGGKVSYDWSQPVGSLLAMGAEVYDALQEDQTAMDAVSNSLYTAGDAFLNLTFFGSLLDLFKGYGSPTENVLTTVLESGATQFAPSVVGALTRTLDDTVRTSYTGGGIGENTLAGLLQKTPGLSQNLPASVNVRGEESKRLDNPLLRALQEFANPSSLNTGEKNDVDRLIEALYQSTGSNTVFPRVAPNDVDGVKLTGEERAQYQTALGQTTYDVLAKALTNDAFTALSEEQQVKFIQDTISYANDTAEREYYESKGEDYSSDWDNETEMDADALTTYLSYKQAFNDFKNTDGETNTLSDMLSDYRKLDSDTKESLTENINGFEKIMQVLDYGIEPASYYSWKEQYDNRGDDVEVDAWRDALFADDTLPAYNKRQLDELITGAERGRNYTNKDSYILSGMSDKAQTGYKNYMKNVNIGVEDFKSAYEIGTTKAARIDYAISQGWSKAQINALCEACGYNPIY